MSNIRTIIGALKLWNVLKSTKPVQSRRKLLEIRKVARRIDSCLKSEKLRKSGRVTYGQPYFWASLWVFPTKSKTRRSLLMKRRSQRMKRRSDDLEIIACSQNVSQSDLKKLNMKIIISHLIPNQTWNVEISVLDNKKERLEKDLKRSVYVTVDDISWLVDHSVQSWLIYYLAVSRLGKYSAAIHLDFKQ